MHLFSYLLLRPPSSTSRFTSSHFSRGDDKLTANTTTYLRSHYYSWCVCLSVMKMRQASASKNTTWEVQLGVNRKWELITVKAAIKDAAPHDSVSLKLLMK